METKGKNRSLINKIYRQKENRVLICLLANMEHYGGKKDKVARIKLKTSVQRAFFSFSIHIKSGDKSEMAFYDYYGKAVIKLIMKYAFFSSK